MSFTAILLVAGVGSRLRPLTDTTPKCLISLGDGDTLLSRMVRQLVAHGAHTVVASTGYLAPALHAALADCPVPVRFAHNPDYDRTQNVVSLHRALAAAPPGEVVKLDGDVVFEDRVLARLLADTADAQIALDDATALGAEEMKVTLSGDRVAAFGKALDPAKSAGESIGIERFNPEARARMQSAVALAVESGRTQLYYEDVYNDLLDGALAMHAVRVGDLRWTEIDDLADLARARALVAGLRGAVAL